MAQVLQFTLPGSPCVYYGVELGMEGGRDPEQRGPMRWDMVNDQNPDLQWMRKLIDLRRESRALKVGEFCNCESNGLLAYCRMTDRVDETVLVVVNPTGKKVKDWIQVPQAKLNGAKTVVNVLVVIEIDLVEWPQPIQDASGHGHGRARDDLQLACPHAERMARRELVVDVRLRVIAECHPHVLNEARRREDQLGSDDADLPFALDQIDHRTDAVGPEQKVRV